MTNNDNVLRRLGRAELWLQISRQWNTPVLSLSLLWEADVCQRLTFQELTSERGG